MPTLLVKPFHRRLGYTMLTKRPTSNMSVSSSLPGLSEGSNERGSWAGREEIVEFIGRLVTGCGTVSVGASAAVHGGYGVGSEKRLTVGRFAPS